MEASTAEWLSVTIDQRPTPLTPLQLQAFFLVADDIMDGSITRRGQPCWYKQEHVGMIAVNDCILLEACIYRVLKSHFASLPCYTRLLEIFHDVTYQTSHGQLLDLITAPIGQRDLTRYTIDTYMRIVTYKTAFYTFYLPGEGRTLASASLLSCPGSSHTASRRAACPVTNRLATCLIRSRMRHAAGGPGGPQGLRAG